MIEPDGCPEAFEPVLSDGWIGKRFARAEPIAGLQADSSRHGEGEEKGNDDHVVARGDQELERLLVKFTAL